MNHLTVIIVSRGLDALLQACTASLSHALRLLEKKGRLRVVIVDNASTDPYDNRVFPSFVRMLRLDTHHSFAACCNRAARLEPAGHYLLLNNDILLHERQLQAMAEAGGSLSAGIVGARLLFPDGTIQHAGVVFGPGPTGPYHIHRKCPSRSVSRATGDFQCVTGACMWISSVVWDELGGLDESYPFGLEDVDFCLRARQRGIRIVCVQEPESLHFESMTEGRVALDVPSRKLFMERWKGRYTIDGEALP